MKNSRAIGVVLTIITLIGTLSGVIALPNSFIRDALIFACSISIIALMLLVTPTVFGSADVLAAILAMRKFGILRIYSTNQENVVGKHIASSRNIKIMAVSANGLIKKHRDEIVGCLRDRAATIQVLLARPNSEFVSDVEQMESLQRVGQIGPEITNTENLLSEYVEVARREAPSNTLNGRLEIGYYGTQFRSSIIICDNTWGCLTLSLPPMRSLQTISLELVPAGEALLAHCIRHFDKSWELARANDQVKVVTPLDWLELLVSHRWVLIHKPPDATKPISFSRNGTVSEGQNDNEHSWRLRHGRLELLRKDGRVHSRFDFDKNATRFTHTNDPDTLSNRDQIIHLL